MALPKLNDTPKYEMVIPSSGKMVKYRPFLVKEQKTLLIAYESRDIRQIMNATLGCIESCVPDIEVNKLSTFDVDYMFTQIRSKSAGETTTVVSKCMECEHDNEITINLNEIDVGDIEDKTMLIPITDKINLKMKYPTYEEIINSEGLLDEEKSGTERMFSALKMCLESVQTEDENIVLKDESDEEIENFINSLTNEQFEMIQQFIDNIPKLRYVKDYNCEKCNVENKILVEGLQDFFS